MQLAGKYQSAAGDYDFHTWAWEARMCHRIESFILVKVASARSLIAVKDSNSSLDEVQCLGSSLVRFLVRKYSGDHTSSLARIQGGSAIRFIDAAKALDALYRHAPDAELAAEPSTTTFPDVSGNR